MTLTGGLTGTSSSYLTSGHLSTNDVYLCLNIPDENRLDSTYLKQRYTLFNSTQVIRIMNGVYTQDEFVFPSELNLIRGNDQNRYFSDVIADYTMFMRETLRSYGMLQQYSESLSPSFNKPLKQLTKFAMIRINLEAFKQESALDQDVIYDGYNSE